MTKFQLREMERGDLELVLCWRNKPEIRKNMFTTHIISLEEHTAWFERMVNDKKKRYLMCLADDQPVGVVGFYNISIQHGTAEWAFYSGDLSQRGIGSWMEYLALNYAFEVLKLNKLSGEVLSYNMPVVKFHQKHGFKIEGIFRAHHEYEGELHDVYRVAIFRNDWLGSLQDSFRQKLNSRE